MRKYQGAPAYANVPLTGRDGMEIGQRDVPFVQELNVPGTEGLGPFPATPPCPPEQVPQRTPCVPNNPMVEEGGLQIFSQWSGLDASGDVLPETPAFNSWQMMRTPLSKGCSELWLVELWGYEIARRRTAIQGAVGPLNESAIVDHSIELGSQMTRLKARINMHGASGGSTRIVDIGEGVRFAIEACQVSVDVLYPQPGATQVKGNTNLTFGATGGLVLDSVIGGFITPTTSTPGQQITTNTFTMRIPATVADVPIFIPPGTRALDLYQTGVGGALTLEWRLLREGAFAGPSVGQIVLAGNRRVNDLTRPGNAGMITSGAADGTTDRIVTFVFRGEI